MLLLRRLGYRKHPFGSTGQGRAIPLMVGVRLLRGWNAFVCDDSRWAENEAFLPHNKVGKSFRRERNMKRLKGFDRKHHVYGAPLFASLSLISPQILAGWNGHGVINNLWIYPDYVVVQQGNDTSGPAGCLAGDRWSFRWADFAADVQGRIMSQLLLAKTTKATIQVLVSDVECGPEGFKKFTGYIHFP